MTSFKEMSCLPPLRKPYRSIRASQHRPVKPYWKNICYKDNEQFSILEELKLSELPYDMSIIWSSAERDSRTNPSLNWRGDKDLSYHLRTLWDDICNLTSSHHSFNFLRQSGVYSASNTFFPDFEICKLSKNKHSFFDEENTSAFIEILCPSSCEEDINKDLLSAPNLVNSVISRMVQLHVMNDIPDVIVLVTNYNQWKFFWIKSSDWLIKATGMDTIHKHTESLHKNSQSHELEIVNIQDVLPRNEVEDYDEGLVHGDCLVNILSNLVVEIMNEDESTTEEEERGVEICSTKTYFYNDPAIVELLASFFEKITYVREPPVSSLFSRLTDNNYKQVKYALVNEQDYVWTSLPSTLEFKLAFCVNAKSFYLLYELNDGRDGRTWLGCTLQGHLCVLKFGNCTSMFRIKDEAHSWNSIWNFPAYFIVLAKYNHVVVMPFCFVGCFLPKTGNPFFTNFKAIRNKRNAPISKRTNDDKFILENFVDDFTNNNGTIDHVDSAPLRFYLNNPLKAAEIAITDMIQKGYQHLDLKWSHIALLPQFDKNSKLLKVRPILIDLFDTRRIGQTEDKQKIIKEGMENVVASMQKTQERILLADSCDT
jgi:hypothetical protein